MSAAPMSLTARASSTLVARWSVRRLSQVMTVGNVGSLDLVLDNAINLPSGYSLVSGFGTTLLAPGQDDELRGSAGRIGRRQFRRGDQFWYQRCE